jgi:hypothetical protein
LGHTKSHTVLGTEFFEFTHNTVGDAWDAFGQKAVHHGSNDFHFVADGKVDKVGID